MIIIVMGVSGSGKSTIGRKVARALGWTFADADSFHPQSNVDKMSRGIPLSEADRKPWLAALRRAIEAWLNEGSQVVLACSALRADHRRFLSIDQERIRIVYLKGSFELIESRLANRPHHFMPKELLHSQMSALEEPTDAVIIDASWPPDQIVDRIRTTLESQLQSLAGPGEQK